MPMILCPYCPRAFATERDLEQHQQAKRRVSAAHGYVGTPSTASISVSWSPVALATSYEVGIMCEDCGEKPADLPSRLCPGCEAYREHTGQA